jgi:hypothetical protein
MDGDIAIHERFLRFVNQRLTTVSSQPRVDGVRVTQSAFRHGIDEADILHAYRNALRYVEFEQHGEERLIVIGPDRSGRLLELVAMPAHDATRDNPRGSAAPQVLRLPVMR